jgi:hypothetical protein
VADNEKVQPPATFKLRQCTGRSAITYVVIVVRYRIMAAMTVAAMMTVARIAIFTTDLITHTHHMISLNEQMDE